MLLNICFIDIIVSNKVLSLVELDDLGFPVNPWHAIDLSRVPDDLAGRRRFFEKVYSEFYDGFRPERVLIRTALSSHHETMLFLKPDIPAIDNEAVIDAMMQSAGSVSKENGFTILQKFTPQNDYVLSFNLLFDDRIIIEFCRGDHTVLARNAVIPATIQYSEGVFNVLNKGSVSAEDVIKAKKIIAEILLKYSFEKGSMYEFSKLVDGETFYHIHKKGEVIKPLSKKEFYERIKDSELKSKIIRF